MARRKLTDVEKQVCVRSIQRRKEEIMYFEFQKKDKELQLEMGLELTYKHNIKLAKTFIVQCDNEMKDSQEAIDEAQNKIDHGVDEKDPFDEKNEEPEEDEDDN